MLRILPIKIIVLLLAAIMLLTASGCSALFGEDSPLNDIDLSGMVNIYDSNAPILSIGEPNADDSFLTADRKSYTACTVTISSEGRQTTYGHYTYLAASVKVIMTFAEREYEIIVDLDEFGFAEEKAYTVKFKNPLSVGDVVSGRVTDKAYAGYVSSDPVQHSYPPEEERETFIAYENDICLEHVRWRTACVDCGYVTDLKKTDPVGHDMDEADVCKRCGKTRYEIEQELDPSPSTPDTSDEDTTASEPAEEELDYLRVLSSWAGNASIACQPSSFGEESTKILQLSDLSLVNYIVVETSNELVVEVGRSRTVDVDRGIVEIPYTVMSYGEAVVTVYIHHDDADGVGDVMKLTLAIQVSPIK